MSLRRLIVPMFVVAALLFGPRAAHAGNYIVYLHGRATNAWPPSALLGVPAGWSHITFGYDGSARLADSAVRGTITDAIATFCGGGNQCVVVCHSAGCARMLDAYSVLKDQGRYPANILWSEAAASAAGGSELAVVETKWLVHLLAKLLKQDAAVDNDIQPNVMRFGAFANIQNQATSPVYHLAGSQNFCLKIHILFFVVKLCGNSHFPGSFGDGLVPVHSAAGYVDTGAHSTMNDGSAKYVFRAFEQTPLYPVDHFGIFGPLVGAGSLRLAVTKAASCPNMPAIDPSLPDASITFDDADGAPVQESSPLNTLVMCGNDMWNGAPPLYATCLSAAGCCTDFSNGSAGGCSCGETLCRQAQVGSVSYYTDANCTGTEYAQVVTGLADFNSFDGVGMVGQATTSVTVASARTVSDGRCHALVLRTTYSGTCPQDEATVQFLATARRVYRAAAAPPPPSGKGPNLVVSTINHAGSRCP